MDLDIAQIGKAFLVLFAVIDIVGGIPLILQVRQKAGKIYPARATLVSLAIMVTFLFLGETILKFLGLDVNSFAVAGSLVLFFIALEMILGVKLFKEDTSAPGLPTGADDHKVYSIVPLAFPVIAGAGTITTSCPTCGGDGLQFNRTQAAEAFRNFVTSTLLLSLIHI